MNLIGGVCCIGGAASPPAAASAGSSAADPGCEGAGSPADSLGAPGAPSASWIPYEAACATSGDPRSSPIVATQAAATHEIIHGVTFLTVIPIFLGRRASLRERSVMR